jgi:hypothetical protein
MLVVKALVLLGGLSTYVAALGEPRVISFPSFDDLDVQQEHETQVSFVSPKHDDGFVIASKRHRYAAPLLLDSKDDIAIHIAAQTFADDVRKVTGLKVALYNDTLPHHVKSAIIVGSLGSRVVNNVNGVVLDGLKGKWESYDARVMPKAAASLDEALVVVGSDRVCLPLRSTI